MTVGPTTGRPDTSWARYRVVWAALGALSIALAVLPPLLWWAQTTEFAEALQFLLLAVVAPPLIVCGAPWRSLHLARGTRVIISDDGIVTSPSSPGPVDRLALARHQLREPWRTTVVVIAACATVILWRLPPLVNAVHRHSWIVLIEAVTLLGVMVPLWFELAESPPVSPRRNAPQRIAIASVVMWTVWVMAYLVGLSHDSWYGAYHHVAGSGLSAVADQQFASGAMWVISAVAFLPSIFWNLAHWIQSDEDPDDELYRLIRDERSRGVPGGEDASSS